MFDTTSIIALISAIVAIGGGLFGLFQGLNEYKNSQILRKIELEEQQRELTLKRQEILFPLVKEFEESKSMNIAKGILDDYINENPKEILNDIYTLKNDEKKELEKPVSYYSKKNLAYILRGHFDSEISDIGELKIRDSF